MVHQLAEDLWRREIPLVGIPLKTLNSYLILGPRSLLVDTGFRQEPCREAMERELEAVGVDRDRMDVFLTHLHSDHTGLAPELVRPGCRVYIGAVDGQRMLAGQSEDAWRRMDAAYVQEGFSEEEMDLLWDSNPAKNAGPVAYDGYVFLGDGDILQRGSHALRCVLTPGHTPGHLCLYEPEARWLFSGDHILFHITPNICRWSGVTDSLGDYLESLKRIRELPVERLLPAHRQQTGDLEQRTRELEAHHARRISDALDAVRREPGRTAYEIAGSMAWSIRCRSWAEFPLTQKYFAVGEALAHLDYLMVRGQVQRREEHGKWRYYTL